jgi:molecular chaperone GrpE
MSRHKEEHKEPQEPLKEEISAEHPAPEDAAALLDTQLQKLTEEAAEYKDKYLRLLAEMENTRKRHLRERQEMSLLANERIIADFLHPMDNLENALKYSGQMSDEVKNWAFGFQMILDQFKEVLSQHGVKVVAVQGVEFDPHHHEAIELVETSEYPPGTIIEECTRGYQIGTRTIRPARVKVAAAPSAENSQQTSSANGDIDLS